MLLESPRECKPALQPARKANDLWRESLADQLAPHSLFRRRQISVVGDKGRVVLTGTVGSYYEKQLAQELIRRCDGVDHIDNRLEVDYRA